DHDACGVADVSGERAHRDHHEGAVLGSKCLAHRYPGSPGSGRYVSENSDVPGAGLGVTARSMTGGTGSSGRTIVVRSSGPLSPTHGFSGSTLYGPLVSVGLTGTGSP